MSVHPQYDLAVVGAGSGGFGAALAATRRGLKVVLIEPGHMLGGNSTLGGVNTWEPSVGNPGFHGELYNRLKTVPNAIGVSRTVKHWTHDEPWGLSRIDPSASYADSLRRSGVDKDDLRRVTFEPQALSDAMVAMLQETGNITIMQGHRCVDAQTEGRRLHSITVEHEGGHRVLTVRFVVDATAQLFLASKLGCATYLGSEPKSLYDEPSAPEEHQETLNGVSVCFRITPVSTPTIEPLPDGSDNTPYETSFSITEYPCGDLNLNPLPIMEGMEFHRLGPVEGRRQCLERLHRAWHWLQSEKSFDRYRLKSIFPFTGVREGPRLIGRAVLTENDVRAGISTQTNADHWIATADHALDIHGEGHRTGEVAEPYGIPYGCLLPKEFDNLAVACRGASFTHLAGSSCRLTRTMMQLGHAAGLATAFAVHNGCNLPSVDVSSIQSWLAEDNAAVPI